jgi:DUF1009 family protein
MKAGETLGLIAGNGNFPLVFAKSARRQGFRICAIAFPEETSPQLKTLVDEIHWISIGQLGTLIKVFKTAHVQQAFMAGQIRHKRLFANLKLDLRAIALMALLKDKRADSILRGVADTLGKEGIRLESPLPFLQECLPQPGILTRRKPNNQEKKDIQFGYTIAKHIAGADIGQTVVVRNQAVLAVEAMEGTDACIDRGGKFAKKDAVVVKVTKPNQDLRFDMPVVGPQTIKSMMKVKASVIAFDAGQTLLLQPETTLAMANQARISMVALKP